MKNITQQQIKLEESHLFEKMILGYPKQEVELMSKRIRTDIENKAKEILSHIEDACSEMGREIHDQFKRELLFDIDQIQHINQLLKQGVTDIPGCLADEYYSDPFMIQSLMGDQTYNFTGGDQIKKILLLDEIIKLTSNPAIKTAGKSLKRE